MSNYIKVASYNVNGLLNPVKRSKILTKLKKEKIEIALLQETHLSVIEHNKLNRMGFKYVFSASFGSGHRRGVAVLISNKVTYEHLAEIKDREGRYIMIRGRVEGTLVTILNVYAPPGSKCSFF